MTSLNTHPLTGKLGLGTAQFGLDSPCPRGRSPEAEVRDMLATAARAGLGVLDTGAASMHGEAVLGAVMPRPPGFRITVKAARGDRGPRYVEAEARASLARLGLNRADAIMVQSAGDLFSPYGAALWDCLKGLRDAGLFARIGISAYVSDDPAGLARRFRPDLIQAPASLLDQRLLVDGSLASVRDLGVDVHLRSIFLNGLLFLPPDRAPSQLGAAAISRLTRARRMIVEGRSDPLQAALGFALSRPEASAVIVGAATTGELNAVIAALGEAPAGPRLGRHGAGRSRRGQPQAMGGGLSGDGKTIAGPRGFCARGRTQAEEMERFGRPGHRAVAGRGTRYLDSARC